MTTTTRREFLATTSFALVGAVSQTRRLQAKVLPVTIGRSPLAANAWLPEPITPTALRTLASVALDAAKSAGAQYADIRVAQQHELGIACDDRGAIPLQVDISAQFLYGMRVFLNGGWAFVHGTVPTLDAVTTSARAAIISAREYARVNAQESVFAHAPVVAGEWTTPIQLDPFTVPIGDQTALLSACNNAAARVRNAFGGLTIVRWTRETRVFASSEGSLVTQTLYRLDPDINSVAGLPRMDLISIPILCPMSGGYECIAASGLQDTIKAAAEDAARLIWLPHRPMDVGRYPVVFDGATLGGTLGRTLGRALEGDRAVGDEAGASGVSYLSPPEETIGTPIASPLLNVTANRAMPSITATGWDDEGVAPCEFPVVTEGHLQQYFTSRRISSAFPAKTVQQSERQGSLMGCAVAPTVADPVLVRAPNLIVAPNATSLSLEDLCRDIDHGVLVRQAQYVMVDGSLASGIIKGRSVLLEIRNGRVVNWLNGNALQFSTPRLWKALVTLGDAQTVATSAVRTAKGQPDTTVWHSVSAPAGCFKDIDVITTKARI